MTKKQMTVFALCAGLIGSVMTANAAVKKVKTSSLAIAKPTQNQKMPQQCQKLFSETSRLISAVSRQPGTHDTQMQKMQSQLSVTQKQIAKLDLEMQRKSCDKGLTALSNLKSQYVN